MQISCQMKKLLISLNQNIFKPSLPERPFAFIFCIKVLRITVLYIPYKFFYSSFFKLLKNEKLQNKSGFFKSYVKP